MEIDEKTAKKFFAIGVVILLLGLSFIILMPLAIAIMMGLILAFIFHPIYRKLFQWTKLKTFSSLIVCFIFLIIIIIPLYFMLPLAIKQMFEMYTVLQNVNLLLILEKIFPSIFSSPEITATLSANFNSMMSSILSSTLNSFTNYLVESPKIIINIFVFISVFFFGLKNGEEIVQYIKDISPFSKNYEERIFGRFKETTNALIYGDIIAGVIQGLSTGLALFILGIPNVLVLTLLAIFLSMLPIVGAYLIWIPAAIYLFIHGNIVSAIILAIYGLTVITWIDNFVRAFVVSKKAKINSGIIFISMMGGMIVFGFFGIIIGPLIISYLFLILELYKENKLIEKT